MKTSKKILLVYSYLMVILLSGVLPIIGGLLYGYHAAPGHLIMAGSLIWFIVFTYRNFFRITINQSRSSKWIGVFLLLTYYPAIYLISLMIETAITPGEIKYQLVRDYLLFPLSLLWQ